MLVLQLKTRIRIWVSVQYPSYMKKGSQTALSIEAGHMNHAVVGIMASGLTLGEAVNELDGRIPDAWARGDCNRVESFGDSDSSYDLRFGVQSPEFQKKKGRVMPPVEGATPPASKEKTLVK